MLFGFFFPLNNGDFSFPFQVEGVFFLFFFRRCENKVQVYAELKLCTSVVHKNETSSTQNLERNYLIELIIKLMTNSGSSQVKN